MDWYRIKTMFIYIFFVLNILLFIFFIYTVNKNKTEIIQEKEIIERSMKDDNIVIEDNGMLKEQLGYVNVTIANFKDLEEIDGLKLETFNIDKYTALKGTSSKEIANINDLNYKVDIDYFLINVLKVKNIYTFEEYNKKNKTITYVQSLDGIKIFDNVNARIVFKIASDGSIKEFEQTAVGDVKKDKLETLATKNQVITKVYHEDLIPKNSNVKATLGYYTYISQVENQVLIPTWLVEIKTQSDEKKYYVDAINLKILGKNK